LALGFCVRHVTSSAARAREQGVPRAAAALSGEKGPHRQRRNPVAGGGRGTGALLLGIFPNPLPIHSIGRSGSTISSNSNPVETWVPTAARLR